MYTDHHTRRNIIILCDIIMFYEQRLGGTGALFPAREPDGIGNII